MSNTTCACALSIYGKSNCIFAREIMASPLRFDCDPPVLECSQTQTAAWAKENFSLDVADAFTGNMRSMNVRGWRGAARACKFTNPTRS